MKFETSIRIGQVIIWCILVPTVVNCGQCLNSTVVKQHLSKHSYLFEIPEKQRTSWRYVLAVTCNVAAVHLLCKHTLLLQCLHKLCHRFSWSWQCTEVRSIMAGHFDIWWTQFPSLLSPKTCKGYVILTLVQLPSILHLHYLFAKDKYLYYHATSLPNRFSTKILWLLLVIFT